MTRQFVGSKAGSITDNGGITLSGLTGGIDTEARAGDTVIIVTSYAGPDNASVQWGVLPEYGFTQVAKVFDNITGASYNGFVIGMAVDIKRLEFAESGVTARISMNPGADPSYVKQASYAMHVWRGIKGTPAAVATAVNNNGVRPNAPAVAVPLGGVVIVAGASATGENLPSTDWGPPDTLVNRVKWIYRLDASYKAPVGIGAAYDVPSPFDPEQWPGSVNTGGDGKTRSWAAASIAMEVDGQAWQGSASLAGTGGFVASGTVAIHGSAALQGIGGFSARAPRPGVEWEGIGLGGFAASAPRAMGGSVDLRGVGGFIAAPGALVESAWVDDAHGIASETILPYNATALERDLERGGFRLDAQPVPIERLWNPATCPPQFLPWLAWAMSVDTWDSGWPDATKREVIRTSVMVHRKKGTLGAIKLALQSAGIPTEIREWWEEGGTPHTFRLLVDAGALMLRGQSFTAALMAQIRGVVDPVKPVRSHYAIFAYFGVDADYYLGAVLATNARLRTQPYVPTKLRGEWTWAPVSVGVWRAVMGLRPATITQEVP